MWIVDGEYMWCGRRGCLEEQPSLAEITQTGEICRPLTSAAVGAWAGVAVLPIHASMAGGAHQKRCTDKTRKTKCDNGGGTGRPGQWGNEWRWRQCLASMDPQ